MTTHRLRYIGGLQHIRTDQYVEMALQHLHQASAEQIAPSRVNMELYNPLLRGNDETVRITSDTTGNGSVVTIHDGDQACAEAQANTTHGPRYQPQRQRPDEAIEEHEPRPGSYESLHDIVEETETFQHEILPHLHQSYSHHGYASLALYGKWSRKAVSQRGGPPLAITAFNATYQAELPKPGNTITVETELQDAYQHRGRDYAEMSSTLREDTAILATASFTVCEADDMFGHVTLQRAESTEQ